jgi:hypothetical protein
MIESWFSPNTFHEGIAPLFFNVIVLVTLKQLKQCFSVNNIN